MNSLSANHPRRPAWIEINLQQLKRNFQIIRQDTPPHLRILSVVKDEAYGHGAIEVTRVALENGVAHLAVGSPDEAVTLREQGIKSPILLFGERSEAELPLCLEYDLACCANDKQTASHLARLAAKKGKPACVHVKVDTGMSRYGVRWTEAVSLIEFISSLKSLTLEGVMSHFSMSDELDKSFAVSQCERFNEVLSGMRAKGIRVEYRHLCNSGGFLDLPQAHLDMVRLGILPLGVYPSQVCRRIPGIEPVMTVKAKIAAIKTIQIGDKVGYGMHYQAHSPRRVAVLPIGYGDGYPRVRNQGFALIHGQRATIIGGSAMDAIMVDVTDVAGVNQWDEAVLMGKQGAEEISAHEIARWKGTVSYEVLCAWRRRLSRVYLNED